MAEGVARNTAGGEGAKTVDEAFEELKAKVKTQEQFDTEAARRGEEQVRKKAGFEALSQTQLEDEFADEFAGAPRPEGELTPEEIETIQTNKRQQDLFGKMSGAPAKGEASTLEPTATLQVTPSGEALLNQEQIDAQDFRRLAEKQHQELIDAGVKSAATEEMSKLLNKTREGSQVDLFGGKKGTLKEEVIPARVQDFGTTPVQEDVVTRAAQQAKATADMGKVLEKTKEGAQVDLFGGKKGTIKEVAIPEVKVDETVTPEQVDLLDEAKQLEFPRLLTALKGLTKTGKGGPDVATLLGTPPAGQRKATDFATVVHAEVGAKDTDVITPTHIKEAGVRELELGKVIEKAGGLPISDPKVSAAINKLTPEKQVALTNVLSKEYSPENYIKPSEMLVSKKELTDLNIPERSDLIGELFTKPKVETVNVVNNPAGAQQVITKLVAISKNKNAPPAVQAAALQKAVTIEQTLAKVKAANNKAVAAKTVTTKGANTNTVTKDDVAYSVAPVGITTGHTTASLSKTLSPEMKRLVASGKAVLHDTADTLPGTGHPVNVQGMTTADGVTHYVANKLTPSTIQNVALHEVGVHAGMRKMLGSELWAYVKHQAMTNQSPAFVKARASVPEGTPDHLIEEETLAYLVENSPSLSIVRQIVASIRNFMRSKFGANIRLSEADARQMATAAMRKESKTAERTSREETAYTEKQRIIGKSRKGLSNKEVLDRIPELAASAKKMQESDTITNEMREEHQRLVDLYKSVEPYETVPKPVPEKQARFALENGKGQSEKKAAKYGLPAKFFKLGDWVQFRLDIPSYSQNNTWINSIHIPKSMTGTDASFKAGDVDFGICIEFIQVLF
jgi:preprotein translocase subunit YajC